MARLSSHGLKTSMTAMSARRINYRRKRAKTISCFDQPGRAGDQRVLHPVSGQFRTTVGDHHPDADR